MPSPAAVTQQANVHQLLRGFVPARALDSGIDPIDFVVAQPLVRGKKCKLLGHRLSDEKTVEGVSMELGEFSDGEHVIEATR